MRSRSLCIATVLTIGAAATALTQTAAAEEGPAIRRVDRSVEFRKRGGPYRVSNVKLQRSLESVADYIHVANPQLRGALKPLLEKHIGPGPVGRSRESFKQLLERPRGDGGIYLGFAGPVKVSESTKRQQKQAVADLLHKVGPRTVYGTIHGGTLWDGFLRAAHEVGREKSYRQVSVGVMPLSGVPDLLQALDEGYQPERKMTGLAIVGEDYTDPEYTRFMAGLSDAMVVLGGNAGAAAEAEAASHKGKFAIGLPIGDQSESPAILKVEEGGRLSLTSVETAAQFIKNNIATPTARHPDSIWSSDKLFRHITDNRMVMSAFVGTSGSIHNAATATEILERFYETAFPSELRGRNGFNSGGTDVGFVPIAHKAAGEVFNVATLTEKGLEYRFAPFDKLVLKGTDWGDESKVTIESASHMVALGGGGQAEREIKGFLKLGDDGWSTLMNQGWPAGHVIALYDESVGGTTYKLFKEGFRHERLHYFPATEEGIAEAAKLHRELMRNTAAEVDRLGKR